MIICLQGNSHNLICHKKSRLLIRTFYEVRQAVTVHTPVRVLFVSSFKVQTTAGSRTSFLLLGRLSIGTVTCRQFSGRPCANSGRPRHSLHGKPAVFTAATSRFTAIMSQLLYSTRAQHKMQELFLYFLTNIFGRFHDLLFAVLISRTFYILQQKSPL